MRRDSLAMKLKMQRVKVKLLHECWGCHAVGLKPGVLETHLGDYGWRDVLGKQYQELALSIEGLCAACAAATVPASQE